MLFPHIPRHGAVPDRRSIYRSIAQTPQADAFRTCRKNSPTTTRPAKWASGRWAVSRSRGRGRKALWFCRPSLAPGSMAPRLRANISFGRKLPTPELRKPVRRTNACCTICLIHCSQWSAD
jgi:hypothetical protein